MSAVIEKKSSVVASSLAFETTAGMLVRAIRGARVPSQKEFFEISADAFGVRIACPGDGESAVATFNANVVKSSSNPVYAASKWALVALEGRKMDEPVTARVEGGSLILEFEGGRRKLNVSTDPPKGKPLGTVHPVDPKARLFVLPQHQIDRIATHVAKAIAQDSYRAILCGVFFDTKEGCLVATDTHRLAFCQCPEIAAESAPFLMPRWIVERYQYADQPKLYELGGRVWVQIVEGDLTVTLSGQQAGTYPAWRRVVPTEHVRSVLFDRDALAASVRKVSGIAKENAGRAYLSFGPNLLTAADASELTATVSAQCSEIGEADESLPTKGTSGPLDGFRIALNWAYVRDAIGAFPKGNVLVLMLEPTRPVLFHAEGDTSAMTVVMPMAL